MRTFILALTILTGCCVAVQAQDSLHLPNGATLPGKLLAVEDGEIIFDADFVGVVRISSDQATVTEAGVQQEQVVTGDAGVPVMPVETAETAEVVEGDPLPLDEPVQWYEFWRWDLLSEKWNGEFLFGMTNKKSNVSSQEVRTDLKLTYQMSAVDQFQWEGYYEFKEQDNVSSTDKYGASMRYRHDISDRWFVQTQNKYDVDRIKHIRHNLQNSIGVGYRVIDTETIQLNLVPGVGAQYLDQQGPDDGWFFKVNAYEDFKWIIWRDLTFEQRMDFWIDPAHTNNYNYSLSASLTTTLVGNLILRLSFKQDYDNNVQAGTSKSERTIVTSIGYKF